MAIKLVDSVDDLLSALRVVKGGDTILLEDGDYGYLYLSSGLKGQLPEYDSTVTIAALNPGKATFSKMDVRGASNLAFEGLDVSNSLQIWYNSSNVAVRNSTITNLTVRDTQGADISGNTIGGGSFGLVLQAASDVSVRGNYIHDVTTDLVRIVGNSHDVVIENNLISDTVARPPTHPDLIQMFGLNGATPHDITIRGNILHDDLSTGSVRPQGIFMNGPMGATGFQDILIEQNLIWTQHINTIYINGADGNFVIRDNSMIATQWSNGANIRLAGWNNEGISVTGNVSRAIGDEGNGTTAWNNYNFGTGKWFNATGDQTDIFQSPQYIGWKSFLPVAGSAIDFGSGYGAQGRLKELLAGVDNDFGVTRLVMEETDNLSLKGHSKSWFRFADGGTLDLDEATVSLTFSANSASGARTILSKDSAGLDHGFSATVNSGTLTLRFEDDSGIKTIVHDGIAAKTDYNLVMSFDDGKATAWLNGRSIGQVETGMDWSKNGSDLILGADGGLSKYGPRSFFSGTVGDLRIYDQGMTYSQLSAHVDARESYLAAVEAAKDTSHTVFYHGGITDFKNTVRDAIVTETDDKFSTTEGTVALNFRPELVNGGRGLVSRDSTGLGDGFHIAISNGSLVVKFEDDDGTQALRYEGIERYKDYSVVASFGNGVADVWVNNTHLGQVETNMDWTDNSDSLILGALNSNSAAGTTSAMHGAYFGALNGVLVVDESMTPQELAAYIDAHPLILV